MTLSDLALFCLEMAGDYSSNYQRSWSWLRGLNSGYTENYLEKVLTGKGWINEKETDLKLLNSGRDELFKEFPLLQWRKKKWDGKWRVVMYDIPERQRFKRDKLRRFLRKLGFGQWQISVWVSPHPLADKVNQFFEKADLSDVCGIYESKRISGLSDSEFAKKVWGLADRNNQYRKALSSFKTNRKTEYLELLMADPMLPRELLSDDWLWEKLLRMALEK